MPNQTGALRGTLTRAGAPGWRAVLLTCVAGAAATATAAPNPEETYRWRAALVTLDEAAGTVKVRAPAVDPAGLAPLADVRPGEPIVITWSGAGAGERVGAIHEAVPRDGARPAAAEVASRADAGGLAAAAGAADAAEEASAGLLLEAAFVAVDADSAHVTFEAPLPAASLGTVRALTPGSWIVATSPRRPAGADAALLAVAADGPSPGWRPAPERGATYLWHGELVALDEARGTLTVKSRVASPASLAALDGAKSGAPIVVTWSGYESRASGIRSAMPDDGSGLWGGNRFLLRATLVEADEAGGYLTFETAVPAASLPAVRSLTRGSWASVRSPHHPADGSPAVLSVAAYGPSRERRPAPLPGATYRWDGELVALDEARGTLTVKSRVASPASLAALDGAKSGAPIVVTWSGYESRASGIRSAMPDDGSGLWGGNRFLLRAAFVAADAAGGYLTFRTEVPEKSLGTVRSLTRGAWASVTSPHHPADAVPAVLSVDAYVPSPEERRPAPLPGATYRWDGELVSLDETAGTLTVRSRVASPTGLAAIAEVRAGAPIVITWSGYDSQANGIRSVMPDDGSGLWGSNRFLLRATFVAADAAERYLTFEVAVPEASLETVRSLTQGAWTTVTSPHHPADAAPAVMAVTAYAAAPAAERSAQ